MTDEREFEQLRKYYLSLPRAEPGELVDARIRAAAREAVNRRSIAAWTAAFALAASIGFGVILIPSLLLKQEKAYVPPPAEVTLYTQRMPSEEKLPEPAAPVVDLQKPMPVMAESVTVDMAEQPAASLAARQSLERESAAREEKSRMLAQAERRREAIAPIDISSTESAQLLGETTTDAAADFETLRAELDMAPERQWRATLIELRDHQQRALAEKLMPEYRKKFDLPDSLTLDQLVADAAQ